MDWRDLVAHCDVLERQRAIPPSARHRGLYFKNIASVLKRARLYERYAEYFPETYSALRWYPLSHYLERVAVAGALLEGPERVHQGMREIGRYNATSFADSLLGKVVLAGLASDPSKLCLQASAARRLSCNYGRWEVSFPEPRVAVMTMHEEYLWLESLLLGAAEGSFESIGVRVTIDVRLDSQFAGCHLVRWD